MKLNPIMLALSVAITCLAVNAQTPELGSDIYKYKRFLLYPHLQKGFEAMKQGNRNRALTEFEQAYSLAPNNAVVATYLADAYRHFGERDKAEALLKEQQKSNPNNLQINKTFNNQLTKQASEPTLSLTPNPSIDKPLLLPRSAAVSNQTKRTIAPLPTIQRHQPDKIKFIKKTSISNFSDTTRKPVSGIPPGYYFADTAYKSSAAGDFSTALAASREAMRLEPMNPNYGKLLLYILVQTGDYKEAEVIASNLLKDAVIDEQEFMVQRDSIRQRLAFAHFEAANNALLNGDTDTAERESHLSVAYAPNLLAHRVQLIRAQLAASKLDEANQTITTAFEELREEPSLLILRGYVRQRFGLNEAAAVDFNQAINDKRLTSNEKHNFRIIAAHAAMAAGEPKRALTLLEPLDAAADKTVDSRRQLASSTLQRSAFPNPMNLPALTLPDVVCTGFSFTPTCDIWPSKEQADPAAPFAQSAYKAFALQDYAVAAIKANEAIELSPASKPYRLLLVNALIADGQLEQADQNATRFIKMNGDDAEMLAARSALRQRLGQRELANEDASLALRTDRLSLASELTTLIQLDQKPLARERLAVAKKVGLLNGQPDTSIAYLSVLVGDDESALAAFNRAKVAGTLPNTATQDAAYTAARVGRNDQALEYFKQTIDMSEASSSFLMPQQLFNTRREIAERSRQWGANTALTYRGISPSTLAAKLPGASNDSLQADAVAWWRPLDYRDGRVLELYAGVSATLSSKAGFATGADSLQGTLGARVKPLEDVNLILAIERRFAIGAKTTTDWLSRIAYSAGTGTDLRVDTSSWMTATVYTEAGRFIKQRQTYATFEGQIGRSYRLDAINPKLVVFPHAVLGADYNSSLTSGSKAATGVGAGVNLRHWFNEDRYNAPRSYSDISLQYRKRIGGDDRAKGVFLRFSLAY